MTAAQPGDDVTTDTSHNRVPLHMQGLLFNVNDEVPSRPAHVLKEPVNSQNEKVTLEFMDFLEGFLQKLVVILLCSILILF